MNTVQQFEQADAIRADIYGLLRLMRGCSLDHARGASIATWSMRYMAAVQAVTLALAQMNNDDRSVSRG